MRKSRYIFMLFFAVLAGSCHRTKTITGTAVTVPAPVPQMPAVTLPITDKNILTLLNGWKNNELPFTELAARLRTKVVSPELNQSFTTNIRWKKGEKIWLSMSIIGIEGARVLITRDSIKIMDKINNRYILKPLSYIKQKTLVDLSYDDIENLLSGQMIFTDSMNLKYAENEGNITLLSTGTRFMTNLLFDKSTKDPVSVFVTDKMYGQTIDVTYANYQQQSGKSFSMDRELKMKNGIQSFEMTAKFQSIEIKENLEYPFSINPGYTIEK